MIGTLRQFALWIGAIAGALCLLASAVAFLLGVTPLVFRSGSMSPGIPVGALAVAIRTPVAELRPGDIVSVIWSSGDRVTHRLVSAEPAGGDRMRLTTKGDANPGADLQHPVVATADRVLWSTPGLGYAFETASQPQWVFFGGVGAGALLVLAFRRTGRRRARRRRARPERTPRQGGHLGRKKRLGVPIAVVAALGLVTTAVVTLGAPRSTLASFTDTATASTAQAAATLQPPTITGCTFTGVLSKSIHLSWTAPVSGPAPAGYAIGYTKTPLLGAPSSGSATTSTLSFDLPVGALDAASWALSVSSTLSQNWVSSAATKTATVTTFLLTSCT